LGKINVAIIGAGNCACALVQGVQYYKDAKEGEFVPGLMHVNLGGYHVRDLNFVAAFDIDKNKVARTYRRLSSFPPITFLSLPRFRTWASPSSAA